ncbi:hypothetical protein ABZ547_08285 [Streptomyces sparsogenes]|uniref:hypothetical protein n=1 Tax=Streptomyces sparsogenes TaxID=67365 RepID=UPI0033D49D4C
MNRSTTLTPPPTASLFDGDRASSSARASVTVGAVMRQDQIERAYAERAERAAYRLDVVTRYAQAASWEAELKVLAEAARFDKAHPGEPSLYDELHGMTLGLAA